MARKNILDITAQKFAAKKLALRRMILRKLATRRLAARKTAALGMVMLLLGGCHVAQLTTLYTDETSVEENGIRYDAAHRPITGAVSYTHLDVYKRQRKFRTIPRNFNMRLCPQIINFVRFNFFN